MKTDKKVFVKGQPIILAEKKYKADCPVAVYKAAGGEGTVYCTDKLAYKVYHDSSRMIPVAKIKELSVIKRDNILAPMDLITDSKNEAIGFTMPYVTDTEFLCKLFVKNFKDQNSISQGNITDIVKELRETLIDIHKVSLLVADYNEMNFLVDKDFKIPYHIDVDSWQTKSFRATVLMETVRDRTVTKGDFSEGTDWFGYAVVSFQLYTGLHPYKGGMHPKYKPKDWSDRMDAGISVFDKDVKLPPFVGSLDSLIPTRMIEWYKNVFVKNDRSVPPVADAVIAAVQFRNIVSTGDFIINLVYGFQNTIRGTYDFNGRFYVVTSKGVFQDDKLLYEFKNKESKVQLAEVVNFDNPVMGYKRGSECIFASIDGQAIARTQAEDFMSYNGCIYTIHNGKLIENSFELFGKLIHKSKLICNVYEEASKLFKGILVQDIVGKCWIAIPYKIGFCINMHIPELDGLRIVDAVHERGNCVFVTEHKGVYSRISLFFVDKEFKHYTMMEEKDFDFCHISFTVLPNGVGVLADNSNFMLFRHQNRREFNNPPIDASVQLCHRNSQVMFIDENKLYSLTMGKKP